MNENYADKFVDLVKEIFGEDSIAPVISSDKSNNLIRSLRNPDDAILLARFRRRLEHLNELYRQSVHRGPLLVQIRGCAERQWQGSYSEIIALDNLNSDTLLEYDLPIELDVNIDNSRTFAAGLGKTGTANLDGRFPDADVYFDIKSHQNIVDDIFANIKKGIQGKSSNNLPLQISHQYDHDQGYVTIIRNRQAIITTVTAEIANKSVVGFGIPGVPGLTVKLIWNAGVHTEETSYEPYRHALNNHLLALNYADKFVRDRPFFLVFVLLPWNSRPLSLWPDNRAYYRAFSRRVFCQYEKDAKPMSDVYPEYTGNESLGLLSKYITGIIFIKDNTYSETEDEICIFTNPNAVNRVRSSMFDDYLERLGFNDHFHFDNY